MTYDADGEILTETRYSNLAETDVVGVTSYTYNADGQITSILDQNAGGTTVAVFTYTYDLDNRVLTETNTQAGTVITTTYTYNADSELTSEDSILDPTTIDYNYDADGNRIGARDRPGQPAPLRRHLELHLRRRRQPDREGRRLQRTRYTASPGPIPTTTPTR